MLVPVSFWGTKNLSIGETLVFISPDSTPCLQMTVANVRVVEKPSETDGAITVAIINFIRRGVDTEGWSAQENFKASPQVLFVSIFDYPEKESPR